MGDIRNANKISVKRHEDLGEIWKVLLQKRVIVCKDMELLRLDQH